MKMLFRLLSVLLVVYGAANGAAELTVAHINANLGHLNDPPGAANANECFAFKEFIEGAQNPTGAPNRRAAIHRLRELLNSNNFLENVRPYLKNTDFLSDRLLELEIGHRNAQGDDPRIIELRDMMVRIDIPGEKLASGILIPIPDIFNAGDHHGWGILTCGHILDDVSIEKKPLEAIPEDFTVHLNAPIPVEGNPNLDEIPVHSIKVFKIDSVRLQNNNGAGVYEGLQDNTVNAQTIRAIPRYQYPGDLALCYLNLTLDQINAINLAKLAAPAVPGNYPHIQCVDHAISFQSIGGFAFNFKFVNDIATRDALVVAVNGINRLNNFVLGYPAYSNVLTLSQARQNDVGNPDFALYPNFIDPTDVAARPANEFMFFHDAPTYPGMSGGPVFNTPADNNEINIFGVVQGYDSPEPPDDIAPNNKLQSRCGASFLMERILN